MKAKIAVIKGDGIGPEVVSCAVDVLSAVGERFGHEFSFEYLLAGGAALDACGEPLPEETVQGALASDAVLLGAVGDPKWDSAPADKRPERAILGLRDKLGLFCNLRPVLIFDELVDASPIKAEILRGDSRVKPENDRSGAGLDLLIVRELTGGIYFGPRGSVRDYAYDVEIYHEDEVRRIAHKAFEAARVRGGHVTSVDKANVLDSSRLWRRVMEEVHSDYEDVKLDHIYVDNMAQQLVMNPGQFDVIVTNNIFGDILSDEASQITGSIGMLPSASLGEGKFGLYEPIHGSAPDIAGKDKANPAATILSTALLLRYSLGLTKEAEAVESAVNKFLKEGYRTADIYTGKQEEKKVGTKEAGAQISTFI
jgi:3-isopropylmalate dehydrogenase